MKSVLILTTEDADKCYCKKMDPIIKKLRKKMTLKIFYEEQL